jgi:hypothetical protein
MAAEASSTYPLSLTCASYRFITMGRSSVPSVEHTPWVTGISAVRGVTTDLDVPERALLQVGSDGAAAQH